MSGCERTAPPPADSSRVGDLPPWGKGGKPATLITSPLGGQADGGVSRRRVGGGSHFRSVEVVVASQAAIPPSHRRRPVLQSFVLFVSSVVMLNVLLAVALDHGPPHLRDPEYGHRLTALRQRTAEHPHRPLTVVLGSSRTAQGIRPDVYEQIAAANSPLLYNLSQSGGGPVLQLLTLRRLLADGVTPAAALVEFWPPFLRGDLVFREQTRIDPKRLRTVDEPTVREFFDDPDAVWAARHGDSVVPLLAHRRTILTRLCPDLIPQAERTDTVWREVDGWGWWPGRVSATPEQIAGGWHTVETFYGTLFATYRIDPTHDRAFRTLLAECRDRSIPVTLVRMPESPRFAALHTPTSVRMADDYLAGVVTQFGVPVIDGRTWADDDHLPDGFHLTRVGAEAFTRRFARVMPRATTNSTSPAPVSRP